jgi:hypothetical protein
MPTVAAPHIIFVKRAALFAGAIIVLAALAWAGYCGTKYLRHVLQIRFAEMHAFMSDETPFSNEQLSDEEISARENETAQVQSGAGEISWALMSQAGIEFSGKDVLVPRYPEMLRALNHQQVQVRGFMFPLDTAAKQVHFLLSPYPPSCPYCLPAAANELIEVFSEDPVKFNHDALSMRGKFELLTSEDDLKTGMFYQIKNAEIVNMSAPS